MADVQEMFAESTESTPNRKSSILESAREIELESFRVAKATSSASDRAKLAQLVRKTASLYKASLKSS